MDTPASRSFLLAVEGGGSKTTAQLTDLDGKSVGRGYGPGSNPTVSASSAGKAVAMAVDGALINATGRLPAGSNWRDAASPRPASASRASTAPEDEASSRPG